MARAVSGAAPSVRIVFAGNIVDTVLPTTSFGAYNYTLSVSQTADYALVFEGRVRQQLHTDTDPSAVALIDAVLFQSSVSAAASCNLDVDADGRVRPTTDALAIARTMMGLAGGAVSLGARGALATVSAAALPASVLAQTPWLDIDGNGALDAATDGVLLLRALLGLSGTAVTNGALGASPTRADWPAIRGYLSGTCGVIGLSP